MNRFHKTADISIKSKIGAGTLIWNEAQVREDVVIGKNCILGKGVYIDKGCLIGDQVKIQNYSSLYRVTLVENYVFIGPYVCFANDKYPRASTIENELKTDLDWNNYTTRVCEGASLGAGVVVLLAIGIVFIVRRGLEFCPAGFRTNS
jgi:acetyltransferase-like isoleucine patch superfamily enzyme